MHDRLRIAVLLSAAGLCAALLSWNGPVVAASVFGPGSVAGYVQNGSTGRPVTSFTIEGWRRHTPSLSERLMGSRGKPKREVARFKAAPADPAGRFQVEASRPGTYDLVVEAEGFLSRHVRGVELAPGRTVRLGRIELTPDRRGEHAQSVQFGDPP